MKTRRKFIGKLGGLAALLTLSSNARTATSNVMIENETRELDGSFVHIVFFWLINDDQETKKLFLSELRKFIDNVDVIKTKYIGSVADTDREVIDNSYSYCLTLSFDSKKQHDIYQEHELHLKFIERASSLWDRVLVYDSVKVE
jgi:hypothetical protein